MFLKLSQFKSQFRSWGKIYHVNNQSKGPSCAAFEELVCENCERMDDSELKNHKCALGKYPHERRYIFLGNM